jgi:hypothetical protein
VLFRNSVVFGLQSVCKNVEKLGKRFVTLAAGDFSATLMEKAPALLAPDQRHFTFAGRPAST